MMHISFNSWSVNEEFGLSRLPDDMDALVVFKTIIFNKAWALQKCVLNFPLGFWIPIFFFLFEFESFLCTYSNGYSLKRDHTKIHAFLKQCLSNPYFSIQVPCFDKLKIVHNTVFKMDRLYTSYESWIKIVKKESVAYKY